MISLLPILSLTIAAQAGIFLDATEPTIPTNLRPNNWARSFPHEDGWWFGYAGGGDYGVILIDEQLSAPHDRVDGLTGRSDLIDHALTRCPDGGFMHVSFSNDAGVNSHHSFRYDSEWALLQSNTVVDADPSYRCSDPAVLCSEVLNATSCSSGASPTFVLIVLNELGGLQQAVTLPDGPGAQGAAMLADADSDSFFVVGTAGNGATDLMLQRYDATDFGKLEDRVLETPFDSSRRVFWPQGFMRVGDYYILSYVASNAVGGPNADTGDIWLSAYDADWNLVESMAVAEETEESHGYMRPGLARKGDQLLVTFDHHNGDSLSMVTLDLVVLGVEEGDSGIFDTGPIGQETGDPDDSGDSDDPDDSGGCRDSDGPGDSDAPEDDSEGCSCGAEAAGSWSAVAALMALVGLRRRRR